MVPPGMPVAQCPVYRKLRLNARLAAVAVVARLTMSSGSVRLPSIQG